MSTVKTSTNLPGWPPTGLTPYGAHQAKRLFCKKLVAKWGTMKRREKRNSGQQFVNVRLKAASINPRLNPYSTTLEAVGLTYPSYRGGGICYADREVTIAVKAIHRLSRKKARRGRGSFARSLSQVNRTRPPPSYLSLD